MCFSPYLELGVVRGVSQGIGTQLGYAVFYPGELKKSKFLKLIFLIL